MINEIRKLPELKGKIIADLKLDHCGDLWIKFTDNTFTVLVVNDITEGFGYEKNEVSIYEYGKNKTNHMLVELGLISEKEYKEACIQEEIAYQKRQTERENEEKERIKQFDLEQFNKLKSKYNL